MKERIMIREKTYQRLRQASENEDLDLHEMADRILTEYLDRYEEDTETEDSDEEPEEDESEEDNPEFDFDEGSDTDEDAETDDED